jgi:hypothetical protein
MVFDEEAEEMVWKAGHYLGHAHHEILLGSYSRFAP